MFSWGGGHLEPGFRGRTIPTRCRRVTWFLPLRVKLEKGSATQGPLPEDALHCRLLVCELASRAGPATRFRGLHPAPSPAVAGPVEPCTLRTHLIGVAGELAGPGTLPWIGSRSTQRSLEASQ